MSTNLSNIHPDIIETHILPRLDGRSLSTVSSSLHALCSHNYNLWSHVSKCMWPSIAHPHVNQVISTFPDAHRSFFHDSFPSLIADINSCCRSSSPLESSSSYVGTHPFPSQLISAVDIRYKTDVIYSAVEFTNPTTDFLSSELLIKLNQHHIDMDVDELAGVDEEALSHLKESLTLNWIVIDPTLKRAGNLSTIKPVTVKKDWITNETLVQYVTVLPGYDPNEMVQFRIQVVLAGKVECEGLRVKEVTMKLRDLNSRWLNGKDFLVISQRALILGDNNNNNNVRRKVVEDEERCKSRGEFKEMKRKRRESIRKEVNKRDIAIMMNNIGIFVSFCFSLYFLSLILQG